MLEVTLQTVPIILDFKKGSHVHGMFNALLAPLFAGASVISLTNFFGSAPLGLSPLAEDVCFSLGE